VGAGWSLNAGGVITRTVVGAPDDRGNNAGSSPVIDGYYTDFGFYSYLNAIGPLTPTPDDVSFDKGFKDGEPDLYFFNFGGYSGKFYFNDDRTPIFLPDQDFKVQPFYQIGPGFIGFIVTTPDGTNYYFGQSGNDNTTVNPVEWTEPTTLQNGYGAASTATSSWFLNKIVSADGMDSINLSYQQENYSFYTISTNPVTNNLYNTGGGNYTVTGYNVVKNFVNGVRLSQITFPNGSVVFTPSSSPRTDLSDNSGGSTFVDAGDNNSYSLSNIAISNAQGFCKSYTFYYGYFYDANGLSSGLSAYSPYSINSDEYKLRLDSVQESSCDASLVVPSYKFSYISGLVPRRLSFGIDHWGYSNGISTNGTLVPTYTIISSNLVSTVYSGATRDASWPDMAAGTLQQITYPTGGTTNFSYGPKAVYNYTSDADEEIYLGALYANVYGQDSLTTTTSFSVSGNGSPVIINVVYSANTSATLTIVNNANVTVFSQNFFTSSFSTSVQLTSLGPCTATLTVQNADNLSGGAYVQFYQYQIVGVQTTQTVGGLRINSITNSDSLTPIPIVTSYNYLDSISVSNDILYSIPTYVQVIRNDIYGLAWGYCSPNGCLSCDGLDHLYFISPGSIQPMGTLQGENLGYNEVDVTQTGNGTSIYRYYPSNIFTNADLSDVCIRELEQSPDCSTSIPNFPSAPIPFEPMKEELSYEGHLNQAGQILKETFYYPVYTLDSLVTPGHMIVNMPGMVSFTEYNLQSYRKMQEKAVQNTYDPTTGNKLTSTNITYFGSPYHNQPTRKVASTSTGDSLVTNVQYAMDLRIASCDAVPDSLPYYMTTVQNDSATMVSNIDSCPSTDNGDNCKYIVFTAFREALMQARQQLIAYRRRSFAPDTLNLVSSCYLSELPSADTLLKPVLRLQNMYENVPIETTHWRDLSLTHSEFIRYDTSISPIGFAYPGRTKLINLQAPSPTFTLASVSGNTISKDSRYQDEDFYIFLNGKLAQVLPHNGVTISYIWDYLNTEPIAKATNSTQSNIAYTSFESNGQGGWSFSGAPAVATYAPTGIMYYSLSNGSITKTSLNSSLNYIVSYWSNNGGGGGSSYTVTGSNSVIQGPTINGWTYYEHQVSGVSSLTISGSGNIDELRLYPSNAQMTTYTYTPLVGMSSSCDVDNRATYYNYDALGRLHSVRDKDGNTVKAYSYHYGSSQLQQ
jgi:YD repeat-containing protein